MHILISGIFWSQPNTGSGQYLHNLLQGLLEVAPQHRYTLLLPTNAGGPPLPPGSSSLRLPTPFDRRSKNLAKLWFEQVAVPQAAGLIYTNHSEPTLLHVPYAAPPLYCQVPVVTTVHDIIWKLLPEYAGSAAVRTYYRLVSAAIRRTPAILTDSHCSRMDIVRQLACPPDRVQVIYLAAGTQYRPHNINEARAWVWKRYGIPAPFIYYQGGFDVRKNVQTLVRAFSLLRRSGSPATLVLAGHALGGDRRLFPDLDGLIAAEGLAAAVRRIPVPPEDGPLLYSAASAAAYPSRYEGFGLPPLEAMACGTPSLVANTSSLPEVVDTAAICLPSDDPAAWAAALRQVLDDPQLRDRLREQGLRRAAHFTWQRVARETVAAYEGLVTR